jgi:dTDP-4-dehydrorhamnose reductase
MKLLLLGGDGQLGQRLLAALSPLGEVVPTTLTGALANGNACERLDLTDLDAIAPLIERIAPDVVVNATAHTAVDKAESEPDLAHRINAEAPARIARACAARDALLVHYSTDYVFDGRGTRPYRETDPTAPLGVYGRTKRAGEEAVQGSGARHMIFRTAWVYDVHGHNFLRTMLRVGAERDELRVVDDQVGSPTPAWLLADTTATILRRPEQRNGLWHLTATGQTSWHGLRDRDLRTVRRCAGCWRKRRASSRFRRRNTRHRLRGLRTPYSTLRRSVSTSILRCPNGQMRSTRRSIA